MRNVRLLVMALAGLFIIGSLTGCMSKPDAGEIGVVRNGGPLDNHNIRQVVPNGAGNTWVGWMSSTHYYPDAAQQRFFRMCGATGNLCDQADAAAPTVPSSDGVEMTIEGTMYLNTVFGDSVADPSGTQCAKEAGGGKGDCLLKAFDTQFATRTFGGAHVYDGDGWSKFLSAIVEPIIVNNLREIISGVTCADLVSSCALVQNQGNSATVVSNRNNKGNITKIQDAVQQGLVADLNSTLRKHYFGNIQFKLTRVTLPPSIQGAIDKAQSAFAQVSQAQAKVQSAKLDSQANEVRQAGYLKCPTCARIDAIKALPPGLTALGGNFALGVK